MSTGPPAVAGSENPVHHHSCHWAVYIPYAAVRTPSVGLGIAGRNSQQGDTAEAQISGRCRDFFDHVDTELGAKDLLNNSMAYVAVSRGAYDAQFFTNDREKLGAALGHDVSHRSAHMPEVKQEQAIALQREIGPRQEQGPGFGIKM